MTKLFLQSGKLMIGEFPEEPTFMIDTKSRPGKVCAVWNGEIKAEYDLRSDDYAHAHANNYIERMRKKHRNEVESAKASAVEVVNGEDCFHKINDWLTPLPGGGLGRQLQKGELCDLPKGWTVEIEKTLESSAASLSDGTGYAKVTPTIIARLIPSENAQGAHYGDACGICGGPCVVGSKGLYCPKCQPNKALNEVGIVAAGIAEAGQPESLTFLNEDDWTVPESGAPTYAARLACTRWLSQCLEFGWRKDQLDGLEKIWWQHHDRNGVLVKPDKAVSPPSQAESDVLLSWLEEERNILLNSATLMWHDMETRGRAKHTAECITTTINYIRESRKQPTNQ